MVQQPGGDATRDAIDRLADTMGKLASETEWPNNEQGHACRLLALDISEHGWLFAAGYLHNRLSPTLSLARPLIERLSTLAAAAMDPAFAGRYLDTGGSEDAPRRRRRARSEDARGILGRVRHPDDREARRAFHDDFGALVGTLSEYLHGSLLSPGVSIRSAVDPTVASGAAILVGYQLVWSIQHLAIAATLLNSRPDLRQAASAVEQWRDALHAIAESGDQQVEEAVAALQPWLDEFCSDLRRPDLGLSHQG